MKSIANIIQDKNLDSDARNKHEFQAFGNRLAEELEDTRNRGLYIKLAKDANRKMLEKAREFVLSQENITTKGKLFMWKYNQLKREK